MFITFDSDANASYLQILDVDIKSTETLLDDDVMINIDYSSDRKIVGIELIISEPKL